MIHWELSYFHLYYIISIQLICTYIYIYVCCDQWLSIIVNWYTCIIVCRFQYIIRKLSLTSTRYSFWFDRLRKSLLKFFVPCRVVERTVRNPTVWVNQYANIRRTYQTSYFWKIKACTRKTLIVSIFSFCIGHMYVRTYFNYLILRK